MLLTRRECFQLLLLLLCVPAQYWITWRMTRVDSQHRTIVFNSFVTSIKDISWKLTQWETWRSWAAKFFYTLLQMTGVKLEESNVTSNEDGECPAIEVFNLKNKTGYFAGSSHRRTPHPDFVSFRVGQVVTHKTWGYRGVIIGWDPSAQAPEEWLKVMHPSTNKEWRKMPNYAVLVDSRDRSPPQTTYVPQENLKLVTNIRVVHPRLDDHFSSFDGAQYLPRPWLQAIYPDD